MANLVPIPWQPTLYLTPSTLGYLQRASDKLGRRIFLSGSDAAYRTYARQAYLYDQYKNHGGNTASSPDAPGQRSHMRGAAFDAILTDAATQAACRAVGLVRDGVETWHWNDPAWASMPIIPTNAATSSAGGSSSTPLEQNMPLDANDKAWLNGGFQAIIDQIGGNGAYANGDLTISQLRRDLGYLHTGAEDGLHAIFAKVGTVTVSLNDAQIDQLAAKLKIDPAVFFDALKAVIPTAEQNGAAARAAIVK